MTTTIYLYEVGHVAILRNEEEWVKLLRDAHSAPDTSAKDTSSGGHYQGLVEGVGQQARHQGPGARMGVLGIGNREEEEKKYQLNFNTFYFQWLARLLELEVLGE